MMIDSIIRKKHSSDIRSDKETYIQNEYIIIYIHEKCEIDEGLTLYLWITVLILRILNNYMIIIQLIYDEEL
jgi:hypothetical protein